MAGVEDKFSQEVFQSDETDGIIPRAIKNLWYKVFYIGSTLKLKNKNTQSKHHSHKFIINRSEIY